MEVINGVNSMLSKDVAGGTKKKDTGTKNNKQVSKDGKNITSTISNKEISNNMIDINNVYKFIDLYFKQKNIMYSHLYNSFDKLLDEDIPNFLKNTKSTFYEKVTRDKVYRYYFKFDDISIKPPFIDMDDEIMLPQHARLRNLTYGSKIVATITQIQDLTIL